MTTELEIQSASPRSRRAILAGALGGLGAVVASALGRSVPEASAAAGNPMILGASNSAGTSQTVLTSSAGGAAFTLKDTAASGTGIFGWSSAATGAGRGLYGRADSPNGIAIQARQEAGSVGTGAAIEAIGNKNPALRATSTDGSVNAIEASHSGGGLEGNAIHATAEWGSGVWGESTNGVGIYGRGPVGVLGIDAGVVGVRGVTQHGVGVEGTASGGDGHGVDGVSSGGSGVFADTYSGRGLWARGGVSGYAVYAESSSGIAVYGNSSLNWSGYFAIDTFVGGSFQAWSDAYVAGNLDVDGTITNSGGAGAKIDHPIDPAGKYLQHSFVESPDMLNVYNGVATLDAKGEATVAMPDYFHALNRDFRYQLTPHGAFSPLFVKAEMDRGRFAIAGGAAGQRVSWQVTGIRQDAWANANRIEVEVDKAGAEVGTYRHPTLHGQPASKGKSPKHPAPTPLEAPAT